jgi:hypothetical protein
MLAVLGAVVVIPLLMACIADAVAVPINGTWWRSVGVVVCGIVVVGSWLVWHHDFQRAAWPSTTATIVKSKKGWLYEAVIAYEFEVHGSKHTGSMDIDDKQDAKDLLARYPIGASATVYYDPERPETSTLEPPPNPSLALPIGFSVAAAAFVALWFRHRRRLRGKPSGGAPPHVQLDRVDR